MCLPPCPPQGVVTVPVGQRTGRSPCPAGGRPEKGSCCLTGQRGCCGRCFSWTPLLQTLLEFGAPKPFPLNHPLLRDLTPECIGQELPAALWLTRAGWCPRSRGGRWGEEEPGTPHPQPRPKPPGQVGGRGGGRSGDPSGRAWASGDTWEPAGWTGHACRALPGPPRGGGPRRGAGLTETTGDPVVHHAASSTEPHAPASPGQEGAEEPGRRLALGGRRAAPGTFQVCHGHVPPGPGTWEALSCSLIDFVHSQHQLLCKSYK